MLPRWRALGHLWAQCWRGRPPPAAQCVDLHRICLTRGGIDSINSMAGSLRFFCDFGNSRNLGKILTSATIRRRIFPSLVNWRFWGEKVARFEASHMSQISYKSTGKLTSKLATMLWLWRIYTCSIQCHTVYISIPIAYQSPKRPTSSVCFPLWRLEPSLHEIGMKLPTKAVMVNKKI